ncbi:hypothetical protein DFR52_103774 [Hoeflea marina]|uniref:DUF1674 domain-containing protein n=1 Tax=Hoeflea marina TaxID=274592 RepID=A0A317PND7_9HYPH|nr:DUF1674 domain-containing protein [Hoeflea marina]PWW00567.1 hypothetical protein DFR52_103774 [Hoeflea marina]
MTEPDDAVKPDADAPAGPGGAEPRTLTPAAERALAEAEARRRAARQADPAARPEVGGRGGADPARYGDWEIGGRAIDF